MTIKELVEKWRLRATLARANRSPAEAMQFTDRANEVAAALEVTAREAFLEGYDAANATRPGAGSPDEAGGVEAWEHSEALADVEACYPKVQA